MCVFIVVCKQKRVYNTTFFYKLSMELCLYLYFCRFQEPWTYVGIRSFAFATFWAVCERSHAGTPARSVDSEEVGDDQDGQLSLGLCCPVLLPGAVTCRTVPLSLDFCITSAVALKPLKPVNSGCWNHLLWHQSLTINHSCEMISGQSGAKYQSLFISEAAAKNHRN